MNLEEYKDLFQSVLNLPMVKKVKESEEFCFQKAIEKYNEYLNLEVEEAILYELVEKSKQKPFSYKKLLKEYDVESIEHKVLLAIGELVSYIDKNAAMKNELNQYEDKRTMALTFVRQNIWVQYLLDYKINTSLDTLPEMIRNAFKYIQNPTEELTYFKQDYRNAISDTFFDGTYESINEMMKSLGIKADNPMNDGYLYSIMFYQDALQAIWNPTVSVAEKTGVKIWSFAPGENGYKWDEFRTDGIMAIGWDNVGNLDNYNSKDEIIDKLTELYEYKGKPTNDALALWQFSNEVQIGDKIFAKAGAKTLLGVGEVVSNYEYDDSRNEYKHIRKVKWLKVGKWTIKEKFAIKTLTDITSFENFCNDINKQINEEEALPAESNFQPYKKEDFLSEVFITDESYETIKSLLSRKKNLILQGPPGVGKTFAAKRLVYSLLGEKDDSKINIIQFHQSYSYEDFIMGYRPNETGFELKEGPFYKLCDTASQNPDNDYYLIIDEINRGNISKIFGELLMLIEADKREEKIMITYSEKTFCVPENLYIIGMMNTADRSLAIIDYALRRRFSFFDLEPAFESDVFKKHMLDKGANEDLINKIKTKVGYVNLEIEKDVNLGKGFRIGHSYFCNYDNSDRWYEEVIKYEIEPLLKEYWFDEEEKAKGYIEGLLG